MNTQKTQLRIAQILSDVVQTIQEVNLPEATLSEQHDLLDRVDRELLQARSHLKSCEDY